MRQRKGRTAVAHLDAAVGQRLARLLVLGRAVAALRIEHHAHLDATRLRRLHRRHHVRVGEQEHADVDRPLGAVQRSDQRLGRVIGQDDQAVRHGGFYNAGFPVPRSRT
ncbi:MAG: hypothetical protein MUF16_29920 [Burkholderiaceae bacterium]|nr:hypothetical protein [Burkholderiaceae bacterium]